MKMFLYFFKFIIKSESMHDIMRSFIVVICYINIYYGIDQVLF